MNGHENLPTDFEIFSTETKNFTTDIEILQARFNYDRNFVGKIQQKLKFSIQDPTESEIFYPRSNRKWKFVNKIQQTLKIVSQDLFKTQQKRNFVPKIQNDRNFQIQDWIPDTGHHMDIQCMSLRHDFSVHCCSTETTSTKNWVLRREEDELYIFWSS